MKRNILVTIVLSLFFITASYGTTWYPSKHECPICKKSNTYQDIGSYGSYIYNWPSKYQYIYWPKTDSPFLYCCVDCHFATYMWDFDSVPQQKIESIKLLLETVKLDKKYSDYLDIPITKRLEIAEKVYTILERDNDFWCEFYRVSAYHYELGDSGDEQHFQGIKNKGISTNDSLAYLHRKKAINLAFKMLEDSTYSGREKENLYIIGAMYNYTNQKDSALVYITKSKDYYYTNPNWKEENVKGFNEYMDGLIVDYLKVINKKEDE